MNTQPLLHTFVSGFKQSIHSDLVHRHGVGFPTPVSHTHTTDQTHFQQLIAGLLAQEFLMMLGHNNPTIDHHLHIPSKVEFMYLVAVYSVILFVYLSSRHYVVFHVLEFAE